MFVLPFITALREGLEAIVFVAGVMFSAPASAVPLPVVVGLAAGFIVGYVLYRYAYQLLFVLSYVSHLLGVVLPPSSSTS